MHKVRLQKSATHNCRCALQTNKQTFAKTKFVQRYALHVTQQYVQEHRGHYFYKLLPAMVMFVPITLFGIFGNLNIVWASIRKPQLRSKCNILIVCLSIADVLHQSGHFALFYFIFSAENFTTANTCYWLELPALIGLNMGTFIMLSLGVDRLLCVLIPIKYKQLNANFYIAFKLSLPIGYAFWLVYEAYRDMTERPNLTIVCIVANAYSSWSKRIWATAMVPLSGITVLVYILTWITIYVKNRSPDRKLMRCLTQIMSMVIVGHFFVSFSIIYDAYNEQIGSETILAHHMYFGVVINATISMNYPIYFINSQEYKQAFKEQLRMLFCRPPPINNKISSIMLSMTSKN